MIGPQIQENGHGTRVAEGQESLASKAMHFSSILALENVPSIENVRARQNYVLACRNNDKAIDISTRCHLTAVKRLNLQGYPLQIKDNSVCG
jgi:hypothetical protein